MVIICFCISYYSINVLLWRAFHLICPFLLYIMLACLVENFKLLFWTFFVHVYELTCTRVRVCVCVCVCVCGEISAMYAQTLSVWPSCSQELSDFKHISSHTFWCFRQYLFLCFSFSLLYSINIIYIHVYSIHACVCACLRWRCIDWSYHFHKIKCCLVCLRTTYWCTTGLFSQRGHRELPVDSYCHLANSSSRRP